MNTRIFLPIVFAFAFPHLVVPLQAQVVPGTGQQIVEVFDDFEDPNWSFTLNLPKSSANIDKVERHPSGFSANGLYLESLYRGTPDFVRRVETPPGGIPGSTGALAMQTMNSGVPGRTSHTFQQDDLIAGVQQKLGYMLPVSWTPSYTCRVYVPPFDKWERRHGSHFGFRADCLTTIDSPNVKGRFFKNFGSHKKQEQYWPGFFIQLNTKESTGQKEDSAVFLIRSDERGHEVPGPKITHEGWWTLGMSFTPDGKVHYYVREGVGNLTSKDHVYSSYPYDYRCEQTSCFFFNVVNQDDGRTWSTRWIVDDPKAYVATGTYRPTVTPQTAQTPKPAATVQTQPAQPTAKVVAPATPVSQSASNASSVTTNVPKVQQATPITKAPVTVSTPNGIPQLATKPTEIPSVTPPTNAKPETPPIAPEKLPEPEAEKETPLAAPAVEELPVTETPQPSESAPSIPSPSNSEASPAPEAPSAPKESE